MELIDDLRNNPKFKEFIKDSGSDPDEFLKYIEKPIEIKTVPLSIIDTIKKISQTPPQTPKRPQHLPPPYLTLTKKGHVDLSKVSVFMTPEKIKEEEKEEMERLKKEATEDRLKKEKEEQERK